MNEYQCPKGEVRRKIHNWVNLFSSEKFSQHVTVGRDISYAVSGVQIYRFPIFICTACSMLKIEYPNGSAAYFKPCKV